MNVQVMRNENHLACISSKQIDVDYVHVNVISKHIIIPFYVIFRSSNIVVR